MDKSQVYLNLVSEIKKMPSISNKSAEKIALWLLNNDKKEAKIMFDSIVSNIYKLNKCKQCNAIIEASMLCDICLDNSRNNNALCIIQDYNNLLKVEKIQLFDGKYFIFDQPISRNLKKVNLEENQLVANLIEQIEEKEINEIIILFDFTIEWEATAFMLKNYIKSNFAKIKIFRPAIGMPVNSSIDYIDAESLEWAIKNKNEI